MFKNFPKFRKAKLSNLWMLCFEVYVTYTNSGWKPGSEKWMLDSEIAKPKLLGDIKGRWRELQGADEIFPWSDDYVLLVWTTLRKAKNEDKIKACKQYGLMAPQEWTGKKSSSLFN
jgi:hypothetical protein